MQVATIVARMKTRPERFFAFLVNTTPPEAANKCSVSLTDDDHDDLPCALLSLTV
jgi:hypothetical protein